MTTDRSLLRRLRTHLAVFSPRRWRWQSFLKSLSLDPERLAQPLAAPGDRDVILCGVPRSGTTLLAAMLHQAPHIVTVMEPWDGMRLPPEALFASLREEIARGTLSRGKLDVGAMRSERVVRWTIEGDVPVDLADLEPDYVLGVKWPAYWRFVEMLPDTKFLVCVRDPFEVIASFKKEGGQLAEGLMYDTIFNKPLHAQLRAATTDPAERRVLLYSTITSRLMPYLDSPNVFVVRYERWASDPEVLLEEISAFLGVPLEGMPVDLRSPKPPRGLSERDVSLIRQHARVAEALGYDLNRSVPTS